MTAINKDIIKKMNSILNKKYENTPLKDLKRFFRSNTNLKRLATDIRYIGIEQFEDNQEYLDNLKSLFNVIVEDKEAVLKDVYESKNNIKQFGEFIKIKENQNGILKLQNKFISYLDTQYEQGMGYQLVDVELKNGMILNNRRVLNSTYLQLGKAEKILNNDILSIKLTGKIIKT